MARAKRASDENYNARRRAKRLLARMERENVSRMSMVELRARADFMESVREQIARSYEGTRDPREVEQARSRAEATRKRLDRMTRGPRALKSPDDRAKAMFQRQVNLARIGAPSLFGAHGKEVVSVFYAATRHIWRGRDPQRRNDLIMKALGVSTLEEAFDKVLVSNMDALRASIEGKVDSSMVTGLTDENAGFYSEVELDPELIGSMQWAVNLNMFR